MKFFLKTEYPCLVKTETDQCELDENDVLEIVDENFLFVYPENSRQIPFLINLNFLQENDFFSVIRRDENTIILLEKFQTFRVTHKEMLNFGGKRCEVSVSNKTISFENDNKKIECLCPKHDDDFKIFKIKDFACVQFEEDLFAYSMKNDQLSHFCGDLEIDGDVVFLKKQFHDSLNREREAKYDFGDVIKMESEDFKRKSTSVRHADLAPYQLLESVKAKDFDFASSFLSDKLKSQIDSNQIHEFFGNFSSFLPLSPTEFITISQNGKNFVSFNMRGDKIDDISVDNL